jgi:hypothetical protein
MKSNLFLSCFAIILLLSAYLERRTLSPPTGAPAEDTTSAPLFSLSPEAVTMLSLRNLDQCVVARKEADSVEFLREVSEMLLQGRVVRRFSPPVKDFSEYGLASATWQIALASGDDTLQPVLLLGRLNPVGNAVYARWDDSEDVLLVGSYFLTAVDVVFERLRSASYAGTAIDASCEEEKTVIQ